MSTTTIDEKELQKKKTVTTCELLEDFFILNKINYFKNEQKDFVIFLLPYRVFGETKINIKIIAYKNEKICRMTFDAKLNTTKDYNKELLSLNSELIDGGTLSVVENSDIVTFSVNFQLLYKTYLKDTYQRNLSLCFYVLNKLIKLDLVKEGDCI